MSSLVALLPAQKADRGVFTWRIWAPVQEITERIGQRVAGSGKTDPSVGENRLVTICVPREYSPKYTIQNRKAILRVGLHLGMLSWDWGWGSDWVGSAWGSGIV
jgi:hypothetical protein